MDNYCIFLWTLLNTLNALNGRKILEIFKKKKYLKEEMFNKKKHQYS